MFWLDRQSLYVKRKPDQLSLWPATHGGNAKSFYHENYQIISEDDDYQTNERLESDFFDDGLKVHHKNFPGTDDALVVEYHNLRRKNIL